MVLNKAILVLDQISSFGLGPNLQAIYWSSKLGGPNVIGPM